MLMKTKYDIALARRERFSSWASVIMLGGFFAVLYVSAGLHGFQGAVLGMAYSAGVAWCVSREEKLRRDADAIWKEFSEKKETKVGK